MAGFLLDENLPPGFADGLQLLGMDVTAISRGAAPPKGASDEEVIREILTVPVHEAPQGRRFPGWFEDRGLPPPNRNPPAL